MVVVVVAVNSTIPFAGAETVILSDMVTETAPLTSTPATENEAAGENVREPLVTVNASSRTSSSLVPEEVAVMSPIMRVSPSFSVNTPADAEILPSPATNIWQLELEVKR